MSIEFAILRWVALLALLGGCGVLLAPGGPPTRAPVFAVMHRFGCLGPCPDYELTVYADGVVQYEGNAYVHVRGKRATAIGAAGVQLLRRRFEQTDFMHLAEDYTSGVDDAMGIGWLIYRDKQVNFESGFKGTPWALSRIAIEIDMLTHSERWVDGSDPSTGDHLP